MALCSLILAGVPRSLFCTRESSISSEEFAGLTSLDLAPSPWGSGGKFRTFSVSPHVPQSPTPLFISFPVLRSERLLICFQFILSPSVSSTLLIPSVRSLILGPMVSFCVVVFVCFFFKLNLIKLFGHFVVPCPCL